MIDINGNPTTLNLRDYNNINLPRIFEYVNGDRVIHYLSRQEGVVQWIDYAAGKVKWIEVSSGNLHQDNWEELWTSPQMLVTATASTHFQYPGFQTMSTQINGPYSGMTEQQIRDKAKQLVQALPAIKNAAYINPQNFAGQVTLSANKPTIVVPFTGPAYVPVHFTVASAEAVMAAFEEKPDDRFPHKCPYCGSRAYIGFNSLECQRGCR